MCHTWYEIYHVLLFKMALSDSNLVKEFKKTIGKPSTQMDGIKNIADGEILSNTNMIVLFGKLWNIVQKKYMFYMDLMERFSSLQINSVLMRRENCP